ncbi:MAG: CYTH domain-containing protein [Bacteroidales bacterium]|nr:CYTH domain-containing protein [Bacteroidales bacterium]
MNKEIERKFLVRGEFIHQVKKQTSILQAYLSVDKEKIIRVRIAGDSAFLSVKSRLKENSIIRNEWEFPVSVSDARELMNICLPGKIIKTRYIVPYRDHIFEVDVFHDKNEGLIIAEIELSFENEQFEKPEWLGEEVTGKPEYYNVNLIK